jgi:hypothetical protein
MTDPNRRPAETGPAQNIPPATAEGIGSAAVGGERDPFSSGMTAMDGVRDMYRSGEITARGGSINPTVLSAKYGPAFTEANARMRETVADWQASTGASDPVAREVARRFTTTWVKVAAKRGDMNMLGDQRLVRDTLISFHVDAVAAADVVGNTSAAAAAQYNTASELKAAKQEATAPDSPVSHADLRYLADNNPSDVLGSVRRAKANAAAVDRAVSGGTVRDYQGNTVDVDERTKHRFVLRATDPTACVERVQKFAQDSSRLKDTYKGSEVFTPARIDEVCRTSATPAATIYDKRKEINDLTTQYKGRGTLTESDIVKCAMSEKDPRGKLDAVANGIPEVRAQIGADLPDATVKVIILKHTDPVTAGQRIAGQANALRDQVARTRPEVAATLRDSDYGYFIAQHGSKDAAGKIAQFGANVARAQEAFAGDEQVNQEVIRHASMQDGDVVTNVRGAVATINALTSVNSTRGVNRHIVQDAVLKNENPQAAINQFVDNRNAITAEHGDLLPPSFVERTCRRYGDPVARVNESAAALNEAAQKFGPMSRAEHVRMLRDEIQQGAAGRDERMLDHFKPRLMDNMRADARASYHGADGSAAAAEAEANARVWLHESGIEGVDASDVARRFGRSWANHTANNPLLREDTEAAKAAFTQYAQDAADLAAAGFRNAGAVAQYNDPHTVIAVVAELGEETAAITRQGHTVTDLRGRAEQYEAARREIEEAGVGTTASDAMKRAAVRDYHDPVGALRRYDENMRQLPRTFADEEAVSQRVVERYAMRPDAEGEVRNFLHREALLEAITGDDPRFTAEVRRELALNFDTENPEVLRRAVNEWGERYETLREINERDGSGIPEWALAEAATRRFSDPERRLRYAAGLAAEAADEDRRLDEEMRRTGSNRVWGSDDEHDEVADPRPRAQNPQDIEAAREAARERVRLLQRLTEGLSDAERELIARRFTGDVVDVDEEDLKRRLGTDDLDAYLEELLQRMRRRAAEQGEQNPYRHGRGDEEHGEGQQSESSGSGRQGGQAGSQGQRSDEERQAANDDLEERLRRQSERSASDFNDRYATMTPDERALFEYKQRGETDPDVEEDLKRRLGTDDLDGYYAGLRNYLGLRDRPESREGEETEDEGHGSEDGEEDGGDDTDDRRPGSHGPEGNNGTYTGEESSPRGIARQLVHIAGEFPVIRLYTDPIVLGNVMRGIAHAADEFNSAYASGAISNMSYAQDYMRETAEQLLAAAAYADAYLMDIVGVDIQANISRPIVDPGEPGLDTEYRATITRLRTEYVGMVDSTREALLGIEGTTDTSINDLVVSSVMCVTGAVGSLENTVRMFSEALQALDAHEAARAKAEQEAAQRQAYDDYDQG